MADNRVAKRYSLALFEVAKREKCVPAVGSDLILIAELLRSNEKFNRFVLSPEIEQKDKVAILETTFSGKVSPMTMYLLRLLLNKNREEILLPICDEYEALRRDAESIVSVSIQSAFALNDSEMDSIKRKAETLTQRKVEPTFEVDPDLIGGVKIQFENTVFDGTLRGQMQKLKDRLAFDLSHQNT